MGAPITLLITGFMVGSVWAFMFNAILGAQLEVFYYGRVIEGLTLWPGTKHQYPLYDTLAMGIQMMVFTYILGRTDSLGSTFIEARADSKKPSTFCAALHCGGYRHRPCRLPCGLRATSRYQNDAAGDRWAN